MIVEYLPCLIETSEVLKRLVARFFFPVPGTLAPGLNMNRVLLKNNSSNKTLPRSNFARALPEKSVVLLYLYYIRITINNAREVSRDFIQLP